MFVINRKYFVSLLVVILITIFISGCVFPKGDQEGTGPFGSLGMFLPLILIFVIFYLLVIRPQRKKEKTHQEMLRNLKKGDEVVTNGGLHGAITDTKGEGGNILVLKIADDVRVQVSRSSIAFLKKGDELIEGE